MCSMAGGPNCANYRNKVRGMPARPIPGDQLERTHKSLLHLEAEDDDVAELAEVLADVGSKVRVLVDPEEGVVVAGVLTLRIRQGTGEGDRFGHQRSNSTDILLQGLVYLRGRRGDTAS